MSFINKQIFENNNKEKSFYFANIRTLLTFNRLNIAANNNN